MPNHTNKSEEDRKQAELNAILAANSERYVKLQQKYGQFTVNPDANLTTEFIQYLERIGVMTNLQGIEFGIEHANKVTENFKELEKHFEERVREANRQQIVQPQQGKGLIIPGRG